MIFQSLALVIRLEVNGYLTRLPISRFSQHKVRACDECSHVTCFVDQFYLRAGGFIKPKVVWQVVFDCEAAKLVRGYGSLDGVFQVVPQGFTFINHSLGGLDILVFWLDGLLVLPHAFIHERQGNQERLGHGITGLLLLGDLIDADLEILRTVEVGGADVDLTTAVGLRGDRRPGAINLGSLRGQLGSLFPPGCRIEGVINIYFFNFETNARERFRRLAELTLVLVNGQRDLVLKIHRGRGWAGDGWFVLRKRDRGSQ